MYALFSIHNNNVVVLSYHDKMPANFYANALKDYNFKQLQLLWSTKSFGDW